MKHPGNKFQFCWEPCNVWLLKLIQGESTELCDHLVDHGLLEGFYNSQMSQIFKRKLVDVEPTIKKVLEKPLHREVFRTLEEEDKKPELPVMQPQN